MKNIKSFFPILLALLSTLGFVATDYNLFGLFDGFGWGPVICTIVNYVIFLMFLFSVGYHICKWIYYKNIDFFILIQYIIAFCLFFGAFLWMENRDPFPNSSYSEEFYK